MLNLMSGMGECWCLGGRGLLVGTGFSSAMSEQARVQAWRLAPLPVEVRQEDFLETGLLDAPADVAVSGSGLETSSLEQQDIVARELFSILKPGAA